MPMSEAAERLWKMCDDYVAAAFEHLQSGPQSLLQKRDTSSETFFDGAAEKFRLSFLLLNRTDDGAQLFLDLRRWRLRLRAARANNSAAKTILSEHLIEQLEAFFENSKAKSCSDVG